MALLELRPNDPIDTLLTDNSIQTSGSYFMIPQIVVYFSQLN